MSCCVTPTIQMSAKYQSNSEQSASSGHMITSQHHQFSSNYYVTGVTCKQEENSTYATMNSPPVMSGLHGQQVREEEEKINKSFVKTERNMDNSARYYQMQVGRGQQCPPDYRSSTSIKEEIVAKPLNYHYDIQSVYSQSEPSVPSTSYQSANHFLFQQTPESCQTTNFNDQMAFETEKEDSTPGKNGNKLFILFF